MSTKVLSKMRLSEGIPFKTCANPPARDQNINRANIYELGYRPPLRGVSRARMVYTYRDLNRSGASPTLRRRKIGIVQKVFLEKASAIARMRHKCVKRASKMRQNGSCFIDVPKCVRNASRLRQKCVKNAWNTFGGEHLLDDTKREPPNPPKFPTLHLSAPAAGYDLQLVSEVRLRCCKLRKEKNTKTKQICGIVPGGLSSRTRSTTTRDRNLQFRGAVSTGFFFFNFFNFLQWIFSVSPLLIDS